LKNIGRSPYREILTHRARYRRSSLTCAASNGANASLRPSIRTSPPKHCSARVSRAFHDNMFDDAPDDAADRKFLRGLIGALIG
jgi:hypothetical protein